LIIRPAEPVDVEAIARVHVDTWRTTYKGVIPDSVLDALSYEKQTQMWREIVSGGFSKKFVYVAAEEKGQVIGFALGGPERSSDDIYTGELYAIYILEAYQRRGLGRQMLVSLVKDLVDIGLLSLLVWVLKANPSRRFYEALGGQYLGEKQLSLGGVQLVEIAYGWRDARHLALD
jgi:GNAT superfamily N-acetyltransferase